MPPWRGDGGIHVRHRRIVPEGPGAGTGAGRAARRHAADPVRPRAGFDGIRHTRLAAESAVTTDGAHPFTTGPDQCLVHNGSLSNHNAMRRTLVHHGMSFETDNDSEVAAGYLTWRMREGAALGQALESSL